MHRGLKNLLKNIFSLFHMVWALSFNCRPRNYEYFIFQCYHNCTFTQLLKHLGKWTCNRSSLFCIKILQYPFLVQMRRMPQHRPRSLSTCPFPTKSDKLVSLLLNLIYPNIALQTGSNLSLQEFRQNQAQRSTQSCMSALAPFPWSITIAPGAQSSPGLRGTKTSTHDTAEAATSAWVWLRTWPWSSSDCRDLTFHDLWWFRASFTPPTAWITATWVGPGDMFVMPAYTLLVLQGT